MGFTYKTKTIYQCFQVLLLIVISACSSPPDLSGLKIVDLKSGQGKTVDKYDTVYVNYVGYFENGQIFDKNDPSKPNRYSMRSPTLIEGWRWGLLGMQIGGKRRLTIPSSLGFGVQGKGSKIPPNTTLVFEIELTKIE